MDWLLIVYDGDANSAAVLKPETNFSQDVVIDLTRDALGPLRGSSSQVSISRWFTGILLLVYRLIASSRTLMTDVNPDVSLRGIGNRGRRNPG